MTQIKETEQRILHEDEDAENRIISDYESNGKFGWPSGTYRIDGYVIARYWNVNDYELFLTMNDRGTNVTWYIDFDSMCDLLSKCYWYVVDDVAILGNGKALTEFDRFRIDHLFNFDNLTMYDPNATED